MVQFIRFIPLYILLFIQPACTSATSEQSTLSSEGDYGSMNKQISHLIKKKMSKNDITGLSIAVVDGQKIVLAEGFGWADKKNKIKATPETVYRVGSITKLFTVTAVMQLAEQGALQIDQPLQEVLPQFSIKSRFGSTDKITLRNIMTHHSGLPTNFTKGMWAEKPEKFTRLVEQIQDEYTAYPPDTIFCYSNIGITLLGHAVQEVSGQPYEELIDRKVLRPLGMSDSYIADTLRNEPQSSKAYSDDVESITMPLRDLPAGGLNSTVLDLANFAKMVFAGGRFGGRRIIKAETLDKMMQFQDGNALFDLGKQIGLGWFLEEENSEDAGLTAMHGGDTFLFHSMLMTIPRHQLAVIVLANSELAHSAVFEIAEESLQLALVAKAGIRRSDKEKLSNTELPAKPEDLKNFPGYYSSDEGVIQIIREDDELKLVSNDDSLDLVLHGDDQYYLQYKLLGLFPLNLGGLEKIGIRHSVLNGQEVLLGEYEDKKMFLGEKIIVTPVAAAWKSRTGSYAIVNPSPGILYKDLELYLEDGFLMLHFSVQLPYQKEAGEVRQVALRVVDDNNAVIHGLGTGFGDTIRVVHQDDEELLSWSGFLLRKAL